MSTVDLGRILPAKSRAQSVPGAFPDAELDPPHGARTSITRETLLRRDEYTEDRYARIKIGSWNVATCKDTEKDLGRWFVDGRAVPVDVKAASRQQDRKQIGVSDSQEGTLVDSESQQGRYAHEDAKHGDIDYIDIYVLGLQEVVDISSPTEALRPYTDQTVSLRWRTALEEVLPKNYRKIAEQQLMGLLLFVYAAPEVAEIVSEVSSTTVGTGLMGYMGNKGAVATRIVLDESTRLAFVNSHLAAGADKGAVERRNWDAAQVLQRLSFTSISGAVGEIYGSAERLDDQDAVFWFGDFNYRLQGMPGDDVRRLLLLHAQNEYGIAGTQANVPTGHRPDDPNLSRTDDDDELSVKKEPSDSSIRTSQTAETVGHGSDDSGDSSLTELDSEDDEPKRGLDPGSLKATILSLLPHDELHREQKRRKAFHDGWQEGAITFLPTYKYDVGSMYIFDSSEKRRCPSWCDRILYRSRRDKQRAEEKAKKADILKHAEEQLRSASMVDVVGDESAMFEYDPDADDDADADEIKTCDGSHAEKHEDVAEDGCRIEKYDSHQDVVSSDHKPVEAIIRVKHRVAVRDRQLKVVQEITREVDKAENEAQPSVTVVIEGSGETSDPSDGIDFGGIQLSQPRSQSITIANTGQVPATLSFTRTTGADGDSDTVEWLRVDIDGSSETKLPSKKSLTTRTIQPGEVCVAHVMAEISSEAAAQKMDSLPDGKLSAVLVLHVKHGRDHFVPVSGQWVRQPE